MSVIAVKVFKSKIVIGSDQQVTYGESEMKNEHNKPIKLYKCGDFVFGSCGSTGEANKMKMFLDSFEPKDITDERGIFSMIKQFKDWGTNYELSSVENVYLFVCNGKVFEYHDGYCSEVNDMQAIGSGGVKAKIAMEFSDDMELILKKVCKHDLFCSEPLVILEVEK